MDRKTFDYRIKNLQTDLNELQGTLVKAMKSRLKETGGREFGDGEQYPYITDSDSNDQISVKYITKDGVIGARYPQVDSTLEYKLESLRVDELFHLSLFI